MSTIPYREPLNEYLKENPRAWDWETIGFQSRYLKRFLRWMGDKKVRLEDLDLRQMGRFFQYLIDEETDHETRYHVRLSLFYFLEWLHRKDYPVLHPRELLPHKKPRALLIGVKPPKRALEYLELVRTKVKPSTFSSYKTAIRHFYRFLSDERLRVEKIDRNAMEGFFKYLLRRNQGPNSRIAILVQVRSYLRWLKEHGRIDYDPETLIKWADLPKRPVYLPRPLSPEVDRLIQRRLSKSKDLFHQGLLLMRWTGIRVGELAGLSFHCLKTDPSGHNFLKVPLGKLNNERLVPLDKKTVALIRSIQERVCCRAEKVPPHLLAINSGKKPKTYLLMSAFKEIVENIQSDEPIVTHRLRHTYATELLSAGINIWALKDILGHHDIRMTLRYAAVTQEKVREEYFAALERMKNGFPVESRPSNRQDQEHNYREVFHDLALELKKRAPVNGLSPTRLLHLTKRIKRLEEELMKFLP